MITKNHIIVQHLPWLRGRVAATAASVAGQCAWASSLSRPVRVAGYQGQLSWWGGASGRGAGPCASNVTVGWVPPPPPRRGRGCSGGYLSISSNGAIAVPGCRLYALTIFPNHSSWIWGASVRPPVGKDRSVRQVRASCFFSAALILIYISLGLNRQAQPFSQNSMGVWICDVLSDSGLPAPCPPRSPFGGMGGPSRDVSASPFSRTLTRLLVPVCEFSCCSLENRMLLQNPLPALRGFHGSLDPFVNNPTKVCVQLTGCELMGRGFVPAQRRPLRSAPKHVFISTWSAPLSLSLHYPGVVIER